MSTKILIQSQAEAVYSAMCALNNVSGRLYATLELELGDLDVREYQGGEIFVSIGGSVERFVDQSAFAAAYRLIDAAAAPTRYLGSHSLGSNMGALILSPTQAAAVYGAMCELSKVGGHIEYLRLPKPAGEGVSVVERSDRKVDIWLSRNGNTCESEVYRDQSDFAAAYGLRQG